MNWADFWNGRHSIYVSGRHKDQHYQHIARDITSYITSPSSHVLDYGCGEALYADLVASKCGLLFLFDTAPKIQEKLRLRFSRNENIVILSTIALHEMLDAELDMVVVNSVLQYIPREEFEHLLTYWHAKMKVGSRLIIADVIPNGEHTVSDVRALLRFAWNGSFFFAALCGLAHTYFSSYRILRQKIGLTQYTPEYILKLLAVHGFKGERALKNIGYNPERMTFLAVRE